MVKKNVWIFRNDINIIINILLILLFFCEALSFIPSSLFLLSHILK